MNRTLLCLSVVLLLLAACEDKTKVNAATDPAAAVDPAGLAAGPPTGSSDTRAAGTGPVSFVGRWAADVSWCANPQGANRPIEITPVRFEGVENSCHIFNVDQTATGYLATLKCQSEGGVHDERVHMSVAAQTLTLTYPDRGNQQVKLLKCTTLGDVAPTHVPE